MWATANKGFRKHRREPSSTPMFASTSNKLVGVSNTTTALFLVVMGEEDIVHFLTSPKQKEKKMWETKPVPYPQPQPLGSITYKNCFCWTDQDTINLKLIASEP
mmetsp:Transcript_13629/g.17758  ORF Transcript_13629/g.17758 Transcript_13629/m.17758 type:complete len:104 (-) Transcript_13629:57-368(-)